MQVNTTTGAGNSAATTKRKHADGQTPPAGEKLKGGSGEKGSQKKESFGDICNELSDAFGKLVDSITGDPEAIQKKDEERILKKLDTRS